MRGMASAKESRECPPNGRYPLNITAATAGHTNVKNEGQPNQKGGDSCIELGFEIAEGNYAGYPAFDTIGTDGGTNFGGMSKKKLRALEVPGLDSDAEIPDEVIAQSLLNKRVWAELEREQQMKKDEAGKLQPIFDIDEKTQVKVPRYRLKIVGYIRQPVAAQVPQVTGQQLPHPNIGQAPQYAQPGAALPQGYPTQLPQAPGFAPGVPVGLPQGYPGAPGAGFAPGVPGMPGGLPQGLPQGFPQVQAPQAWTQAPNGVQGGAAPGAPGLPMQPGLPGVPGR